MRTVIITGANSGLGFETAKKIARNKDYTVILACRNMDKVNKAAKEIKNATGNENVIGMLIDTASLHSVRQFAKNYNEEVYGKVYALLLNAGISGMHEGITEDGMDIIFQTNHLGHFLLTHLMLPHMEDNGKIFSTTSDMHDSPMGKMKWTGTESIAYPSTDSNIKKMRYSYSKLCNIYFVHELAKKLEQQNSSIRVNAFNPGFMETNFAKVTKMMSVMVKYIMPKRFGDLEKSSDALAELVVNDALAVSSANYYDRSINTCKSSQLSYNEANASELWKTSEKLCGLH